MTSRAGVPASTEVVQRLAGEGWEVLPEALAARTLPAGLRNHVPDMIAKRGDELLFVQVLARSELSSRRLVELAEAVRREPNWNLEVVAIPDVVDPADVEDLSAKVLLSRQHLEHHPDVALIVGWAAVEGLLRRLARVSGVGDVRDFVTLLEDLVDMGPLAEAELDLLLELRDARSRIAHGLTAELDPGEIVRLLDLGDSLVARLREAQPVV